MKMNGADDRKINFWFMFDDPKSQYRKCSWCPEGVMERDDGSWICPKCQTIMAANCEREAA